MPTFRKKMSSASTTSFGCHRKQGKMRRTQTENRTVTIPHHLNVSPPEFPDLQSPKQWYAFIRQEQTPFNVNIENASIIELLLHVDSLAHYGLFNQLIAEFDAVYARSRVVARHVRSFFRTRRGRRSLMTMTAEQLANTCNTTKLRPTIIGLLPKLGSLGTEVYQLISEPTIHETKVLLPILDGTQFSKYLHYISQGNKGFIPFASYSNPQLLLLWDFLLSNSNKQRNLTWKIAGGVLYNMLQLAHREREEEFVSLLHSVDISFRTDYFDNISDCPLSAIEKTTLSFNLRVVLEYLNIMLRHHSSDVIDHVNRLTDFLKNEPNLTEEPVRGMNLLRLWGPFKCSYLTGRDCTTAYNYATHRIPMNLEPMETNPMCFRLPFESIKRRICLDLNLEFVFKPDLIPLVHLTADEYEQIHKTPTCELRFASQTFEVTPFEALFFSEAHLFSEFKRSRNAAILSYARWALMSNDAQLMRRCIIVLSQRTKVDKVAPYFRDEMSLSNILPKDALPVCCLTRERLQFLRELHQISVITPEMTLTDILVMYRLNETHPTLDVQLEQETQEAVSELLALVNPTLIEEIGFHAVEERSYTLFTAPVCPIDDHVITFLRMSNSALQYEQQVKTGLYHKTSGLPNHLLLDIFAECLRKIMVHDYSLMNEVLVTIFERLFNIRTISPRLNVSTPKRPQLLNHFWTDANGNVATDAHIHNFITGLNEMEMSAFETFIRSQLQSDGMGHFGWRSQRHSDSVSKIFHLYRAVHKRLTVDEFNQLCDDQASLGRRIFVMKMNSVGRENQLLSYMARLSQDLAVHKTTQFSPIVRSVFEFHHCCKLLKYASYRSSMNRLLNMIDHICESLEPSLQSFKNLTDMIQRVHQLAKDPVSHNQQEIIDLMSRIQSFDRDGRELNLLRRRVLPFASQMSRELSPQCKTAILSLFAYCQLPASVKQRDFKHPVGFRLASHAYNAASVHYHTDYETSFMLWRSFTENSYQATMALGALTAVASISSEEEKQEMIQQAEQCLSQPDLGLVVVKQLTRLLRVLGSFDQDIDTLYEKWYSKKLGIGLRSTVLEQIFKSQIHTIWDDPKTFFESPFFQLLQDIIGNARYSVVVAKTMTKITAELCFAPQTPTDFSRRYIDGLLISFGEGNSCEGAEREMVLLSLLSPFLDRKEHIEPFITTTGAAVLISSIATKDSKLQPMLELFTDDAFESFSVLIESLQANLELMTREDEIPDWAARDGPASDIRDICDFIGSLSPDYVTLLPLLSSEDITSIFSNNPWAYVLTPVIIKSIVAARRLQVTEKVDRLLAILLSPTNSRTNFTYHLDCHSKDHELSLDKLVPIITYFKKHHYDYLGLFLSLIGRQPIKLDTYPKRIRRYIAPFILTLPDQFTLFWEKK